VLLTYSLEKPFRGTDLLLGGTSMHCISGGTTWCCASSGVGMGALQEAWTNGHRERSKVRHTVQEIGQGYCVICAK
jgi:hypothetical protein